MHDEQAPPVTPGAQSDLSAEESVLSAAPATEYDVELPFDGADATAPSPVPPAAEDVVVGAVVEAPAEGVAEAPDAVADVPGEGADDTAGDVAADSSDAPADEAISTDDPEEAILRKLALLAEAEAIVATPDKNESGNAPDDRHLTERMRAVENVWRRVGPAGDREAELRARLQDLRQAYSAARSRRAESRAVDRARAGETKRALLVQAFALAQQVDPTIALPAAPAPRAPRPANRRRPSPAMLARKPAPDPAPPESTDAAGDPVAEATPDVIAGVTAAEVVEETVAISTAPEESSEPAASDDAPEPDTVLAHDGAAEA